MQTSQPSTTTYSRFRPTITVYDDGRIKVEFGDCFTETYDKDDLIDASAAHIALFDSIIDGRSNADALRALADRVTS